MKAIRVAEHGGPDVMHLEEVADPTPELGQVIVQIKAAGVNPVDTYIRAGSFYRTALPYTPGADAAGTVLSVGKGVERVVPGDRVYIGGTISGAYAELALCSEQQVYPLPLKVSFEQGAGINVPYATAYRALIQKARAAAGETVLVHGASGGVGTAAVQLARALGMIVIGTAGTQRGRDLVLAQGAHHALDHTSAGYLEKVTEITGGRGPQIIVEMLANVNLAHDMGVAARDGRIVIIGNRGPTDVDMRAAMAREVTILGMVLTNASVDELAGIHHGLYAGMEAGYLRPVVGRSFPLAQAPQAHEAVMEPGSYGKIILIP